MTTGETVYETLVQVEELDSLAEEWDELVRAMRKPTPFLLHGWVTAWLRHYVEDAEPAIHVGRRDGRMVAALPLVVRRRFGLRIAGFVGDDHPFVDVLLAPGEGVETARSLAERSMRNHDCASLGMITADSAVAEACGERLRLVPRVGAPVLDISDGFEHVYSTRYKKKARNEHARRLRKLAELGEVEFGIAKTPKEIEIALDDVFRLHALRWGGQYDLSDFGTERGARFYRDAMRRLAESGAAQIVTMRLNGEAIAFRCNLVLCRRVFFYRSAHDPAYNNLSPGVLCTLEAIKQAASEGITAIELLGGTQSYKLELTDRVEQLYVGVGLASGIRGSLFGRAEAARLGLRLRLKRSTAFHSFYVKHVGPRLLRLRRRR